MSLCVGRGSFSVKIERWSLVSQVGLLADIGRRERLRGAHCVSTDSVGQVVF